METIAILITTKNGSATIEKALQSIVNQTLFLNKIYDYRIVIVNDKSSNDNIKSILSNYSNIIYEEPNESGLACARNTSLFAAMKIEKCKYFCILDCDDEWDFKKLENQIPFMIKNNIDVCGTGMIFNTTHRKIDMYYPESHDEIFNTYLNGNNPMAHPSIVFDKKILNKCGGYDDSCVSEDYDLFSRAVKHYKFYNIKKLLVNYTYDYDKRSPDYEKDIRIGAKKIYAKFLINNNRLTINI